MITPSFSAVRRVLALGAHSDDIEIGAGGTLLRMIDENSELEVYWAVFSGSLDRMEEARNSASEYLAPLKRRVIKAMIPAFRESYFPIEWANIKQTLEQIKLEFEPDLIFTHTRDDRHQDHRVLSDLAWNTFRNHLILEYEIPKYDGDLGRPNVYVPLSTKILNRKVDLLMQHFETQASKHWFTPDLFEALPRIRGVECASEYAEAFYARKLVLR